MRTELSKGQNVASWIARIVVAVILLQTVFFKFTGAQASIDIFEKVGMEPWGRYGSGAAELVAGILLLVPSMVALGALIALAVILGAIASHLGPLGIEVVVDGEGDGGTMFVMALIVLAGSLWTLWTYRRDLPVIGDRFD
jgi:uncharacterized membrane protein YphA (DoxX/SURF4 family)